MCIHWLCCSKIAEAEAALVCQQKVVSDVYTGCGFTVAQLHPAGAADAGGVAKDQQYFCV